MLNNLLNHVPAQLGGLQALTQGASTLQKRLATVADTASLFSLDRMMEQQQGGPGGAKGGGGGRGVAGKPVAVASSSDAPLVTPTVADSAEAQLLADLASAGISSAQPAASASTDPSPHAGTSTDVGGGGGGGGARSSGFVTPAGSRRGSFAGGHAAAAEAAAAAAAASAAYGAGATGGGTGLPPLHPSASAGALPPAAQLSRPIDDHAASLPPVRIGALPPMPPPAPGPLLPPVPLPALPSLPALGADVGVFFSRAAGTVAGTVAGVASSAATALRDNVPSALPAVPASLSQTMGGLPGAAAGSLKRISAVFASPARGSTASAAAGGTDGGGGEGTPSKGILKFSHAGSNAGNPALLAAGGGGGGAGGGGTASRFCATVGDATYRATVGRCDAYFDCVLAPVVVGIRCFGPVLSLLCTCIGLKACVVGFKRATSRLTDRQLAAVLLLLAVAWLAWSWGLAQSLGSLGGAQVQPAFAGSSSGGVGGAAAAPAAAALPAAAAAAAAGGARVLRGGVG